MGAFIRSKNVLLAELSEGAFIRRGALIRRNTYINSYSIKYLITMKIEINCMLSRRNTTVFPKDRFFLSCHVIFG